MNIPSVTCADCGANEPRRGPSHRYCVDCSSKRQRERQSRWARENPVGPAQSVRNKAHSKKRREASRECGKRTSRENCESIAWPASESPDLAWIIRVNEPFSFNLSKNAIWRNNGRGHVYMRKEARVARTRLTESVREAAKNIDVKQRKLWIDIFVQMPNHRGDATNVVDTVCDAIKDAVGIDDRWFAIRKLDWQIVKDDPRIFVGIGQEDGPEIQACSLCGQLLPFSAFTKHKRAKNGIGRECKGCRRNLRKKGFR